MSEPIKQGLIDWKVPTLVAFGPSQGCGCPWEQWLLFGITLDMHFEPNGKVDVYADAGDWERDFGEIDSRNVAFDWISALPKEGAVQ